MALHPIDTVMCPTQVWNQAGDASHQPVNSNNSSLTSSSIARKGRESSIFLTPFRFIAKAFAWVFNTIFCGCYERKTIERVLDETTILQMMKIFNASSQSFEKWAVLVVKILPQIEEDAKNILKADEEIEKGSKKQEEEHVNIHRMDQSQEGDKELPEGFQSFLKMENEEEEKQKPSRVDKIIEGWKKGEFIEKDRLRVWNVIEKILVKDFESFNNDKNATDARVFQGMVAFGFEMKLDPPNKDKCCQLLGKLILNPKAKNFLLTHANCSLGDPAFKKSIETGNIKYEVFQDYPQMFLQEYMNGLICANEI